MDILETRKLLRDKELWIEEDLKQYSIPEETIKLLSEEIVLQYEVIPFREHENKLYIAASWNIKEVSFLEQCLEEITKKRVRIHFASQENIQAAIKYYYGIQNIEFTQVIPQQVIEIKEDDDERELYDENFKDATSRLAKLVNNILDTAIRRGASDIHILPEEKGCSISFRINTALVNVSSEFRIKSNRTARAIVNRVKAICSPPMTTTFTMPDKGKLEYLYTYKNNPKKVDCRISTMPVIYGEKLVIRIQSLTSKIAKLKLEQTRLDQELIALLKKAIKRESGLVLLVGPTGSGKSTTVHAAIGEFDHEANSIISIEDPVEIRHPGIAQIEVRESEDENNNLTYAKALRDVMRQDPDIIFVGEIRDAESAVIAINAALTGHRVFSTLHARSGVQAFPRLFGMGVNKEDALSELKCIVSQRIIGINCPDCAEPDELTEEIALQLTDDEIEKLRNCTKLKKSRGCPRCMNTGYKDLRPIGEIIMMTRQVKKKLLNSNALDEGEIVDLLRKTQGYQTLWEKAFALVLEGEISISEAINKVPMPE